MPIAKKILLVPEWSDDLSNAYAFTLYEPTEDEIAQRLNVKASQDTFTIEHRTDPATYRRLATDQANLCGACGRELSEARITHLIEDSVPRIVCERCSPFSPFYEGGK